MAPNGYASADTQRVDHSVRTNSRPVWLESEKKADFNDWQKENPTQHLSFEEWKSSKHVEGLSLYYAALRIWEESDSSDNEVELLKAETRPRVRAPSAREPKKKLKTNGHGLSSSVGSATPSATAHSEDLSPSGKKKRKARKKFLSEEVVASEDSDNVGTGTPLPNETTPSAPLITVNGRRKSSNRKPRKKPISEETVSPADEEDDPIAMNGILTPAIASPLPVRSAPKAPSVAQIPQPPKKTILKLSTRKAPKKKILSEETVLDDDTDEGNAMVTAIPSVTALAEPNISATIESHTPSDMNREAISNGATASPDPATETAAQAATRRGLRARRPAQQRPYSFDAQPLDENESDLDGEKNGVQPSSSIQSRRVSIASLGKGYTEDQLDPEILAILQGEVDPDPKPDEDGFGRPKHYKGKGRAWKKEESDEDLEFTPAKRKAAKARAKAKAQQQQQQQQQQQPKKRGRPRKTVLSEDVVRDDSDDEGTTQTADASPSRAASEDSTKRARKASRKSALSEQIVLDTAGEQEEQTKGRDATADATVPEVTTPAPKKRGRPRKSDQSINSKTSTDRGQETEEIVSYTPKGTPNKSYTSQEEPDNSYTPKGEPKQTEVVSYLAVPSAIKNVKEDSEFDSDAVSSQSGIEAHMASVNAEDDEEMCK